MKSAIKRFNVFVVPLVILAIILGGCNSDVPEGFVYLTDEIKTAELEMRYYSDNNFLGRRVEGHEAPKAILTVEAAQALKEASKILEEQGYHIKIFDAYRPQRAVNDFIKWAEDISDIKMKEQYYPNIDKTRLFELGYIASKSGHTRGSVVDLTIVDTETGNEIDMGSGFDFFGEISHHGTGLITKQQEANRNILRDAMVAAGFEAYVKEWWHYSLSNEPYPDTYFDFPVK